MLTDDLSDVVSAALPDGDQIASIPARNRLLRVLVADDYMDAADTLCTLLKMWGHDARAVYDGAAALEMASSYRPDILLSDVSMPKMDGCRLAQELRLQTGLAVTLIAVTGWTDDAHRLQCEDASFDDCLIKPVELSALRKRLLLERDGLARLPTEANSGAENDSTDDCSCISVMIKESTMLVLTRRAEQAVVVGGSASFERTLKVTVLEIKGSQVRLGFEADADVPVHRWEVWERMHPGR